MKQLEVSYTVSGRVEWQSHLGKLSDTILKLPYYLPVPLPGYPPVKYVHMFTEYMFLNIHNNNIINHPKQKATQMSTINRSINCSILLQWNTV